MKFISWNVNGIRAVIKNKGDYIKTSVLDGKTMPPKIYHIDCAREYNLV